MTIKLFKKDGIDYVNPDFMSKRELRAFTRLPINQCMFTPVGFIKKIITDNPNNPPRASFILIRIEL